MKTYRVIRNTWGYKGRYWTEGETVELENYEVPPKHFELVKGAEVKKPIVLEDQVALSQLNKSKKTTSGFAYQTNKVNTGEIKTSADKSKMSMVK